MTRETYVFRNGRAVRKTAANTNIHSCVNIISDALPDLVHPADGKRYDSKSRFRSVTNAHGLVEFGTERQQRRETPLSAVEPVVKQSIERLRAGYRPQALDRANIPRGEFGALPFERVR